MLLLRQTVSPHGNINRKWWEEKGDREGGERNKKVARSREG
jgi:hypothetical protein